MTKFVFPIFLISFLCACSPSKKSGITPPSSTRIKDINLPEITVYRASNTLTNDLVHMKLEVAFDWEKKYLLGKATITLTPHFYEVSILHLNARGMDLHEVCSLGPAGKTPLKYNYQNDSIIITLDRPYKKGEQYRIYIDYTAKPDELKEGGSIAITGDKGLYFINADGKEKDKPQQIWTQGETQANSCWFPTIDSPNQRMTQEISITVDTAFQTLSNGLLLSSVNNRNGTRTDYWKQSLSAAPYLTMMAIGKYAIVKDKWRNMEVSYYVEPEYEKYARLIFGQTPEMLDFFSNRLGVDYPWEKFSQVVVRDYVSGAMENTTAVVHGEYMQMDAREYLDNAYADFIPHELFHHWFGDLVTCESWSNVPLNESFATYGQYLWSEFRNGRDEADYGLQQDLNEYLAFGRAKGPHLIRFDYDNREDMFDVVSYQKGGRILHMLRKIVGDDAFFASLKLYLTANKFKTVESHQLRLAFEEITGQDLNWFFNQWFFSGGYPELKISYSWNDSLHRQFIFVEQNQDLTAAPLYRIPVQVGLYTNGKIIREEIVLNHLKDTFGFDVPVKPLLVNFDSEKMLLASKTDLHKTAEWIYMYDHSPLYLDRYEAVSKLSKNYTADSDQARVIKAALDDNHWNIRILAIKNIGSLATSDAYKEEVKNKLIALIEKDPKSDVRSAALKSLTKNYKNEALDEVYKKASGDSSYEVMSEAIRNYVSSNKKDGLVWLRQFEKIENQHVSSIIAGIYAEEGKDENNDFFIRTLSNSKGFNKYKIVSDYSKFLSNCKSSTIHEGIPVIENVARNTPVWWIRLSGTQALAELAKSCDEKSRQLKKEIIASANDKKPGVEIQVLEMEKAKLEELKVSIEQKINDIKKNETDKNLKKIYGGIGD